MFYGRNQVKSSLLLIGTSLLEDGLGRLNNVTNYITNCKIPENREHIKYHTKEAIIDGVFGIAETTTGVALITTEVAIQEGRKLKRELEAKLEISH